LALPVEAVADPFGQAQADKVGQRIESDAHDSHVMSRVSCGLADLFSLRRGGAFTRLANA